MVSVTVGAIAAAGSVASSAISGATSESNAKTAAGASQQAAQLQAQGASQSLAAQQANLAQTRSDLSPFLSSGDTANSALLGQLGLSDGTFGASPLTAAYGSPAPTESSSLSNFQQFDPSTLPKWDPSQLASTPGYQFTLQQGLDSVQNGFAAKGLGSSGAAMRGGENYATGLASQTYQQQFANYEQQYGNVLQANNQYNTSYQTQANQFNNNYNQYLSSGNQYYAQQQQRFGMLGGVSGSGQNAAAGLGSLSLNSTNAQAQSIASGASALAGGVVGAANASNAGNTGLANAFGNGVASLGGYAQQYGQYAQTQAVNNSGYGYDAPQNVDYAEADV